MGHVFSDSDFSESEPAVSVQKLQLPVEYRVRPENETEPGIRIPSWRYLLLLLNPQSPEAVHPPLRSCLWQPEWPRRLQNPQAAGP